MGFFSHHRKGIGTVVAAVVAGLILNTFVSIGGPEPPELEIAACLEKHPEAREREPSIDQAQLVTYKSCAWPPVEGADETGFSEVAVRRHETGSGTHDYIAADVFDTSCVKVRIRYHHFRQGNSEKFTETADNGARYEVVQTEAGVWRLEPASIPPPLVEIIGEPEQLVVTVPYSVNLEDAVCA